MTSTQQASQDYPTLRAGISLRGGPMERSDKRGNVHRVPTEKEQAHQGRWPDSF